MNTNDYLANMSLDELRTRMVKTIEQGSEGHKVDLKLTYVLADLAKDISAIANTDDPSHYDDYGFIIIGAKRGELVGGVAAFGRDEDKLQAELTDQLRKYLAPVPFHTLKVFNDEEKGRWGVIVIPPSAQQPHVFIKETAETIKHEWWVRVNDQNQKAGASDFSRFMEKGIRKQLAPIQQELQHLSFMVKQQPATGLTLEALKAIIQPESRATTPEDPASDLVSAVKGLLLRGSLAVEDQLVGEALSLLAVMTGTSEENPWRYNTMKSEDAAKHLEFLETAARPLAEAFACVARYDRQGELSGSVARAVRVIAKESSPGPGVHYNEMAPQLRLYPLVICLYALVIVAINERNSRLLQQVFAVPFDVRGEGKFSLAVVFRRFIAAQDFFKHAAGNTGYLEPASKRIREVILPSFASYISGTPPEDAFFIAEFVIALAFLRVSEAYQGKPWPLPGAYLYHSDASRAISAFLSEKPVWLEDVLGQLLPLLKMFDENVGRSRVIGAGHGFDGGAVAALEGKKPG